jgi:ABC-type multidrug transport system ATPase subunit
MDEASLCDRIALIQNGHIMSVDTPQNIINSFPSPLYAAKAKDIYRLLQDYRSDAAVSSCYAFGEYLHLTLQDHQQADTVFKELADKYHPEEFEVKPITPTIEDSFINLMNENHPALTKNE